MITALLLALGFGAALLPPAFGTGDGSAPAAGAPGPGDRATGERRSGASTGPSPVPATPAARTAAPSPAGVGTLGRAPAAPGPTAEPSPTPSRSTAPSRSRQRTAVELREDEVVALTNRERAEAGCGALRLDSRLHAAARDHSEDMAAHKTMSHTGSDGSTPWERAERAGYTEAMAENVAMGYRTATAVMNGWMNSDGHRANILNCDAHAVGVGLAYAADGTPYWTQLFGRA
jgi:uncharacterized protein YkwD